MYDVHDVVDKLKLRAVAKTREFLLQKVYQFRKPMANYQMLQNQLLNYRSPPPIRLTSSSPTLTQLLISMRGYCVDKLIAPLSALLSPSSLFLSFLPLFSSFSPPPPPPLPLLLPLSFPLSLPLSLHSPLLQVLQ